MVKYICLSFVFVCSIVFTSCNKESTLVYDDPSPTANFTFQPGNGGSVVFTSTSENADSYLWEFGDGNTSALKNPTHVYSQPDTYTVRLTVANRNKVKATVEKNVKVTSKPITSVTIKSIALVAHQNKFWDNGNGEGIAADLAVQVIENGNIILSSANSPIIDAPGTQKVIWTLNNPLKITDFTKSLEFYFIDLDVSGYEIVGQVTFKPSNHTVFDGTNQPYANEIFLFDVNLIATASVTVTWD